MIYRLGPWTPTLKLGHAGNRPTHDVMALQQRLPSWCQPITRRLTADGIYGKATEKAVKTFQSTHAANPIVDGIVGPETLGALNVHLDTHSTMIDVSHHQGFNIDWNAVAEHVAVVVMKASEGTTHVDPMIVTPNGAATAYGAIKATGALGYYHYALGNHPAGDEAEHFLKTIEYLPQPLLLALDVESNFTLEGELAFQWIENWIEMVWDKMQIPVLIYTSRRVMREKMIPSTLAYLANVWMPYPNVDGNQPDPYPWMGWSAWQYTNKATVPGIESPCDLSWINDRIFYPG